MTEWKLGSKTLLISLLSFSLLGLITQDLSLTLWVTLVMFLLSIDKTKMQIPLAKIFTFFFLYLFVFRYLVLNFFHQKSSLGQVEIAMQDLRSTLMITTQASVLFLMTLLIFRPRDNLVVHQMSLGKWIESESSTKFSNILFGLSMLGFFLLLFSSRSFAELISILFSHQKREASKSLTWQFGMTFWSLFATPTLSLELLKVVYREGRQLDRKFPIKLIILLLILTIIFGSRLSIMIAGVMLFAFSTYLNLTIKKRWTFFALFALIVFIFIGGARTDSNVLSFNTEKIISATTYPVLDAAALVAYTSSDIPLQLSSGERYTAYLKSMIPRFLWPKKPLLTNYTLDWQIANAFGYENQRGITGWPSGFTSEPFLVKGRAGVMIYTVTLALVLLLLSARINTRSTFRLPGQEFVLIFSVIYFLIAIVKDGDTLASMQGSVRLCIWLEIALFAVVFFEKLNKPKG